MWFIRDTTEPKKQLHVYGKLLTVSLAELLHRWKLYFWQREFLIFTSTFLIVGNSTTLPTVRFTELKETQISLFRMCFWPTSSFCIVLFFHVKRTKLRQQDALLISLSLSFSPSLSLPPYTFLANCRNLITNGNKFSWNLTSNNVYNGDSLLPEDD